MGTSGGARGLSCESEGAHVWWLAATAYAGTLPVVAMGDGLVAGASPSAAPGGWVAVLQDCLEERQPGRYSVVDRAGAEPIRATFERGEAVRELAPTVVVVTFGAHALDGMTAPSLEKDVGKLIRALRAGDAPPQVVLVGVAPAVAAAAADQAKLDEQIAAWNAVLTTAARDVPGVRRVDLLTDWPADPGARAGLASGAWALSDQGHARVAAAVCDAVLAKP